MNNNYAILYDGENTDFVDLVMDGFSSYEQARNYFIDHDFDADDYFIVNLDDLVEE